jgi:zinc protease
MTMALRTGAARDPFGKEGLCRFMGRLMRRTGGGRSTEALDVHVDSLGGSLGVDASHTVSGVHGTVISRSLDPFVELVGDIAARPGFDPAEHARLARETLAEIVEARDHDRALARSHFRRHMYRNHPYGRSVVGTRASIADLSVDDVREFHRQSLVRDNVVFAFSGDIDQDAAEAIAQKLLAALPEGASPEQSTAAPEFGAGRHLVFVDKPERAQTQILIGTAGTQPHDDDHVALFVANTVFGGTFTARLTQEVREKRGWSYGAYSNLPIDKERRALSLWTFPKASDAAACIRLELELLQAFVDRGITNKELTWAKRYLVRSHAFALDTASKRVGLLLDQVLYDLPDGYYTDYTKHVEAVTLDQVNQAIARRLNPANLVLTVVGTATEILDDVRAAIPDLAGETVVAFDSDD